MSKEFAQYWKATHYDIFEKSDALTEKQITDVNNIIDTLQKKGLVSSTIIKHLQSHFPELSEQWKAARAYWTEVKKKDTQKTVDASIDLGVESYKIVLSPSACTLCRQKSSNGAKVFHNDDVTKGEGHVPPFHPNCYCILIPQ